MWQTTRTGQISCWSKLTLWTENKLGKLTWSTLCNFLWSDWSGRLEFLEMSGRIFKQTSPLYWHIINIFVWIKDLDLDFATWAVYILTHPGEQRTINLFRMHYVYIYYTDVPQTWTNLNDLCNITVKTYQHVFPYLIPPHFFNQIYS